MPIRPSSRPASASTLPRVGPRAQAPLDRLDHQPVRTWSASGKAAPAQTSLRGPGVRDAALPRLQAYQGVTNAQLVGALSSADQARHLELKSGKTRPAALVNPEDGSAKVKAFHMAALGQDQTGIEFPLQMARIGEAEGFRLVLRVPAGSEKEFARELAKQKLDNVTLVPVKDSQDLDFWSEDQGELHADGSVSVPRSLQGSGALTGEELLKTVTASRLERLHPRTRVDLSTDAKLYAARSKFPDVAYASVGAVGERGGQRAIAAVALGSKRPLRISNGYLEGGNALVGKRAGGQGYAVVGADSVAVSRAALSRELGRDLGEAEVRKLLAQDYGVEEKELVVVEQPGDFHIDMHMSLMPGGKAVVNDALGVFALQKRWILADLEKNEPVPPPPGASAAVRAAYADKKSDWALNKEMTPGRLKDLEKAARAAAEHEARMVKDLEAGGLKVDRLPGVFPSAHGLARMNFMNLEQGQNQKGDHFVVALGGDVRAEQLVAQRLAAITGQPLRVHFLGRELTETTLNAGGGISCRAKVEAGS